MTRCSADYDKLVSIEELRTAAENEFGEIDRDSPESWGEYCTAFTDCVSRGGREFWKADHVSADVTHIWFAQWDSTLLAATNSMVLVHEGLRYQIIGDPVDINLDHSEIEIQTKREV